VETGTEIISRTKSSTNAGSCLLEQDSGDEENGESYLYKRQSRSQ